MMMLINLNYGSQKTNKIRNHLFIHEFVEIKLTDKLKNNITFNLVCVSFTYFWAKLSESKVWRGGGVNKHK